MSSSLASNALLSGWSLRRRLLVGVLSLLAVVCLVVGVTATLRRDVSNFSLTEFYRRRSSFFSSVTAAKRASPVVSVAAKVMAAYRFFLKISGRSKHIRA